jgi:hypothetical protein
MGVRCRFGLKMPRNSRGEYVASAKVAERGRFELAIRIAAACVAGRKAAALLPAGFPSTDKLLLDSLSVGLVANFTQRRVLRAHATALEP